MDKLGDIEDEMNNLNKNIDENSSIYESIEQGVVENIQNSEIYFKTNKNNELDITPSGRLERLNLEEDNGIITKSSKSNSSAYINLSPDKKEQEVKKNQIVNSEKSKNSYIENNNSDQNRQFDNKRDGFDTINNQYYTSENQNNNNHNNDNNEFINNFCLQMHVQEVEKSQLGEEINAEIKRVTQHGGINNIEDFEETERLKEKIEEEKIRRENLNKKMCLERENKKCCQAVAKEWLQNWISKNNEKIKIRKDINLENEIDYLCHRENIKKDNDQKLNPWEIVLENVNIRESEYKGTKNVSRMRSLILTRKGDFSNIKMK